MTRSAGSASLRDRSAAFWLSTIATAALVALYVGDVADALGGGLADFATFWSEDVLGTVLAGVTLETVLSVVFWVASVALVVVLFGRRRQPGATDVDIEEPAFARFLFHNSRAGLLWLPVRLFLGVSWLMSGLGKLTDPAWRDGSQLAGFWETRVALDGPIAYEWYRDILQWLVDNEAAPWFTWVVTLGEIAVGLGLIVGALTGIAAFFGALMNISFMLAGSASTNPVLFTLAIGIMLAWRVAGYYGLDRYLLPKLGTPWRSGSQPPREPHEAPRLS
jgi:thiosulfate dehydrogenase [quinone] large subunit